MITLSTLNIDAFRINDLALSWTYVPNADEDFDNYTIDIYRAEAPISGDSIDGYTCIASGLSAATTAAYSDLTLSGLYSHSRTWYYKLLITDNTSGDESIYPDVPCFINKHGTTDRIYLEIVRRKNLVLAKKVGRPYFLIKRITYGTRCTHCWDPVSMRITESFCPVCLGTGWVHGYFDPIEFTGEMNPSPKFSEITMFGDFMPSDCVLFLTNFPIIKQKDVIVDDNNKRWVVQDTRSVEKLGKIIEQRVHLALIMEDDPIYEIRVY